MPSPCPTTAAAFRRPEALAPPHTSPRLATAGRPLRVSGMPPPYGRYRGTPGRQTSPGDRGPTPPDGPGGPPGVIPYASARRGLDRYRCIPRRVQGPVLFFL